MSITWSITGTNEQVTFNSEPGVSFDVSSASVTTETITLAGTPNHVLLINSGGAVTALIIT